MAIPAKYVLHCDNLGAEFREEFDGSKIDYTDKTDDMTYCEFICEYEWLYDDIADCFTNNFDKFLDDYFTEDMIPASGYLCYDEVRFDMFGGDEPCLKEDLKFYLDAVSEDGAIIDTKEIKIDDFVNMESQQEFLMECGFSGETDDYIEIALGKFVDESEWSFGLENGDNYIENVKDWPAPKEDGSWVDNDGKTLKPCFWFGNGSDMWILDGEHLNDFWLSSYPENYVVELRYDAFDGYCRDIPGFDEVKKSCPVKIEAGDTPESIDKKIQDFFVEEYRKVHA